MGTHMIMGPFWGNVAVVALAGVVTIACFAAAIWMVLRPGEKDPHHVKYDILRSDR